MSPRLPSTETKHELQHTGLLRSLALAINRNQASFTDQGRRVYVLLQADFLPLGLVTCYAACECGEKVASL
jgi:hypothetical protein